MKPDYKKIIEMLTQKGKKGYFALIGILGVFLILFSEISVFDKKISDKADFSLNEYKQQVEKELADLLREIDGVGDVKVMVSFESGEEYIYAQQQKSVQNNQNNQSDTSGSTNSQITFENEFVIIENSGTDTALLEKKLQPSVQGVAVVCNGAEDISVVTAVTNTVSVVLNVPTHKIWVTKMR